MIDSNRSIDALLGFISIFEDKNKKFYEVEFRDKETGYFNLCPYAYSEEINQFIEATYKYGFILNDFDWGGWRDESQKFLADAELLKSADIKTLKKLLTTHIRADRFVDGHLAAKLDNGHILAILKRLKQIKESKK